MYLSYLLDTSLAYHNFKPALTANQTLQYNMNILQMKSWLIYF